MTRKVSQLLAVATALLSSCTADQLALVKQIAANYQAQIQLTQTDEHGTTTAIQPSDVQTVQLDGTTVQATYSADGRLQLPAHDYTSDHELRVHLRDGSTVIMSLNRDSGTTQGQQILFNGSLYRQQGQVVAADVIPAGRPSVDQPQTAVDTGYVRITIDQPGFTGRLRTFGIDGYRLSADQCSMSDQGELMISRAALRQCARPGSQVWAVVDQDDQFATASSRYGRRPPVAASASNRYALLVMQLVQLPDASQSSGRGADGCVRATRADHDVSLQMGRDVCWVRHQRDVVINNVSNYCYDGTAPSSVPTAPTATPTATPTPSTTPTASPTATPTPTPTPTPSPTPTPTPTATPSPTPTPTPSASDDPTKVHDDNGHGNDPGKYDPSNPGKSKPDDRASASPSPSPSA